MADNREIVFSARDENVESLISRLTETADNFGRSLQELSDQSTQASKDAISYLEKQIELIERRSQALQSSTIDRGANQDGDINQSTIERQQGSNPLVGGQATETEDVNSEAQVELLREIVEVLREDMRSGASSRPSPSSSAPETESGDTIPQVPAPQPTSPNQRTQSSGGFVRGGIAQPLGGGFTAGGNLGQIAQLARSNPYTAAAAVLVAAGAYGVNKAIGSERSLADVAQISGYQPEELARARVGRNTEGVLSAQNLGVSTEDFRQRLADSMRNYGTSRVFRKDGTDLATRGLILERGAAVQQSTVESLERLTRVLGDGDALDIGNKIYEGLVQSGAFGSSGNDMSRTNELIGNFVEIQKNNFYRTGHTLDSDSLISLMNTLEGFGGRYKDAQFAQTTAQSLITGAGDISNPNLRALKTGIGANLFPDLDFFDLQSQIKAGNPEMLDKFLDVAKNSGYSSSNQKFLLQLLLGGGVSDVAISDLIEGRTTSVDALKGRKADFGKRATDTAVDADIVKTFLGDKVDALGEGIGRVIMQLGENIGIEIRNVGKEINDGNY